MKAAEPGSGTYEFFDHAADVGLSIRASTLPGLFIAASRALMEWMGPEPASVHASRWDVVVEAESLEDLLVRWLQELLFHFHQRHAYFTGVDRLEITPQRLEATFVARIWDESRHHEYQEVKAVTYHKLRVSREAGGWSATVILDV